MHDCAPKENAKRAAYFLKQREADGEGDDDDNDEEEPKRNETKKRDRWRN